MQMNNIYKAANLYHAKLEKIGVKTYIKSIWTYIFFLSLCSFIFCLLGFLESPGKGSDSLFSDAYFLSAIGVEIALLISINKLSVLKNYVVLRRASEESGGKFSDIRQCQRFYLKRFFARQEKEYLSLADEIEKILKYEENFTSPWSLTFSQILGTIYDPDSKQRIYGLLLAIASAILALSIRAGSDIETVYAFFDAPAITILQIWLGIVIFLWLASLVFQSSWRTIEPTWQLASIHFKGKHTKNVFTLKYLQRDLVNVHRFVHFPSLQAARGGQ